MFAYAKPEQKQETKSPFQKKKSKKAVAIPNQTGISDIMKTRFESLSGFSFGDVRMHYNSGKPAQLQALAYTPGNQVYVAPGQKKHLGHVVQRKRDNDNVVQRYPVEIDTSDTTKLVATPGRPDVPSTKTFFKAFVDMLKSRFIFRNQYEWDLLKQKDPVKALYKNNYRSTHGLAMCHKMSIRNVETSLVAIANKGNGGLFANLVENEFKLGRPASDKVNSIAATNTPITTKKTQTNELIKEINECPYNYALGNSNTNSIIQDYFDPHLDIDAIPTPISEYLDRQWSDIMLSEPRTDSTTGEYYSSSVYHIPRRKKSSDRT